MDFRRCQRAMAAIKSDGTGVQSSRTIQEAQRTQQQLIEVYRRTLTEQWVGPEDFARRGMSISARSITDRILDGRLGRGLTGLTPATAIAHLSGLRSHSHGYFKNHLQKRRPAKSRSQD